MGNCVGGPVDKEKQKRSRDIDSMISKHTKHVAQEVKLLLLGPGESGKSTIFKQMKIIQVSGGFSPEELKQYRYVVFGNCITQMKVLVTAAEKMGLQYDFEDNKVRADRITKIQGGGDAWSAEIGEDIRHLWGDEAIKKAYKRRDIDFQLNDSAEYFFNNVDRFVKPDYNPTEQDVLRARVRSTGIDEAEFDFGDLAFRMLDVGGQRSERRKWIHCFDCVTAVIFCASLSEYDQTLREDESQNRMKESLLLFDEICNSPWFRDTMFILFLNKTDLFREKILRVPLNVCFSEYTDKNTPEAASEFIKGKFEDQNTTKKQIYTHLTCAISTENVQFVFNCVKETLLNEILNDLGI
eukprot:TRINITY_DN747_c0_g1_i1.p1 TRINITY_DN747_c0_g1~~TRINITY_DN747_c0_g1_i1.p1  ORF type:complete len:353 (+),score=173.30 TRINITY_DN747_c0_g1_i1:82-1140(+)